MNCEEEEEEQEAGKRREGGGKEEEEGRKEEDGVHPKNKNPNRTIWGIKAKTRVG